MFLDLRKNSVLSSISVSTIPHLYPSAMPVMPEISNTLGSRHEPPTTGAPFKSLETVLGILLRLFQDKPPSVLYITI